MSWRERAQWAAVTVLAGLILSALILAHLWATGDLS